MARIGAIEKIILEEIYYEAMRIQLIFLRHIILKFKKL